ncbi:MAG TPA: (2Fe-2S)-binding protein [Acetobacteraceae bacterium]|jgi:predicted molibdopterin-dependent oxidoreductase YjgC|nr:(2Fe-2S)-binding protein [Acetobacteraceae bacterium]
MFRRLHEPSATVTVYLDDAPLRVAAGDTVAAALLGVGVAVFRAAPRHGSPRGPHCMIGNCYECLVEIDGMPYRQACLTTVADGMRIRRPIEREAPP